MLGAYSRVNSDIVASRPATNESYSGVRPSLGPEPVEGPQKTVVPSAPRSDRWMWLELPSRSLYLARKVIDLPCWAAISLATVLYTAWLSAVVRASAYRKPISCWPRLHSPLADSTLSPAAYMVLRISRNSGSARAPPRIE